MACRFHAIDARLLDGVELPRRSPVDSHAAADLRQLLLAHAHGHLLDDLLVHDLFHFFVLLLLACGARKTLA